MCSFENSLMPDQAEEQSQPGSIMRQVPLSKLSVVGDMKNNWKKFKQL